MGLLTNGFIAPKNKVWLWPYLLGTIEALASTALLLIMLYLGGNPRAGVFTLSFSLSLIGPRTVEHGFSPVVPTNVLESVATAVVTGVATAVPSALPSSISSIQIHGSLGSRFACFRDSIENVCRELPFRAPEKLHAAPGMTDLETAAAQLTASTLTNCFYLALTGTLFSWFLYTLSLSFAKQNKEEDDRGSRPQKYRAIGLVILVLRILTGVVGVLSLGAPAVLLSRLDTKLHEIPKEPLRIQPGSMRTLTLTAFICAILRLVNLLI